MLVTRGIRPRTWWQKKEAQRSILINVAGWGILLLLLLAAIYLERRTLFGDRKNALAPVLGGGRVMQPGADGGDTRDGSLKDWWLQWCGEDIGAAAAPHNVLNTLILCRQASAISALAPIGCGP